MVIETNEQSYVFSTSQEILGFLRERHKAHPADELGVKGEEVFPCLCLLINQNGVHLSYLGALPGETYQATGDASRGGDGEAEKEILFFAGDETIPFPAREVISFDTALQCVEEFCETLSRPTCVEWDDLLLL